MYPKIVLLFVVIIISFSSFSQNFSLKHQWSSGAVYDVPECVIYDEVDKVFYVSNVVGSPWEKDGEGFISIAGLDGKPINLKWIEGFDGPKGLAILEGKLYIADIDQLKVVDIEKGKIIKTFKIDGGKNLNDVDADRKAGEVYFSDSGTGNLYMIKDMELSLVTNISESRINGVFCHGDFIYVGGQSIYKVNKKDKTYEAVIDWVGGVDGVEYVTKGWYVVSNWPGKVTMVKEGESQQQILNTVGKKNSADFDYLPKERLLVVPTFFDNQIEAYTIEF